MMTALLSVGAWAQNLQTKTLFEGSQTITSSSSLTIPKTSIQGARVGSQICIYMDLSVSGDQWGDNIIYYNGWNGESVYRSVSVNPGTGIVVKVLLDADVIGCSNDFTISPQNDYSTGTVTKVTLSYNGVNLTSNFGANSKYDNNSGAFQLKKSILTNASEGDILQVSVSSEGFNDGWHMLSLTNGQGDFESMGDPTEVYNAVPTSTEVTLAASYFSDITIGSLLTFNTTVDGLKAVSGETTLYDNMWWCQNQTVLVTYDNINTIKDNGIIVTVNKLKDDSDNDNTLTVKKANPSGTIAYWKTNDFSAGGTVNIPLTSTLLGYASEGEGEGNLYLGGYGFTASSVDLIYKPSAVNIGEAGYATFGYPFAVDLGGLSEGQDAYTVTVSGTTATLTSVKGKKIPANTGIILEGTNGDAISLPLTTEATDEITGNALLVSDGTVTGDGSIYVLANGGSGVGFYKLASDKKVLAGKAYLQISGGAASARPFLAIGNGDDNTTGIDNLTPALSKGEGIYYDLQGRRVAQPTKGLYIVNGRKVVIK